MQLAGAGERVVCYTFATMQWVIAGLGNPGEEYEGTRHNVGRDFVRSLAQKEGISVWKSDAKARGLLAKGMFAGKKVTLLLPDTYMNSSGGSLKALVPSQKAAQHLVVLQDELDMPLGTLKLSFGSGSGGHKGIESIHKALKTRDFLRIRIGICPATPSGKLKKPEQAKIVDFVIGKFKKSEQEVLKKVERKVHTVLEVLLSKGRHEATMEANTR